MTLPYEVLSKQPDKLKIALSHKKGAPHGAPLESAITKL